MSNAWFRMYSDFLEDAKIISLAFEDQRHFIGVLALKSAGLIDQECTTEVMDRLVAQKLWVDRSAIVEVKRRLVDVGLIDEKWQPLAWNKRQFISDRDPTATERQQRKRARDREIRDANNGNANVTRDCHASVTGSVTDESHRPDTDTDTDTDPDPETEEERDARETRQQPPKTQPVSKRKVFSPPSVEDVARYCQERGNAINAEYFVDFYASKGWKVGKERMADWKAAVRNWEKRDTDHHTPGARAKTAAAAREAANLDAGRAFLGGIPMAGLHGKVIDGDFEVMA